MPRTTSNYGLKIFDREEDKTQYFIDYRDAMAGTGDSNMQKIDDALHYLATTTRSFEEIIVGDGLSKHFMVPTTGSHGINSSAPSVSLIDLDSNAPVITAWEAISANQIMITFKSSLPVGKKYKVQIS